MNSYCNKKIKTPGLNENHTVRFFQKVHRVSKTPQKFSMIFVCQIGHTKIILIVRFFITYSVGKNENHTKYNISAINIFQKKKMRPMIDKHEKKHILDWCNHRELPNIWYSGIRAILGYIIAYNVAIMMPQVLSNKTYCL